MNAKDSRMIVFQRMLDALETEKIVSYHHAAILDILARQFDFTDDDLQKVTHEADLFWINVKKKQDEIIKDGIK